MKVIIFMIFYKDFEIHNMVQGFEVRLHLI